MSNVYEDNYGIRIGSDAEYVLYKALALVSQEKDPYKYFRHTFITYGLYPRRKPNIAPPQPKTMTVDIPGADGELDYTESLTGDVKYENRIGEFYYTFTGERKDWDKVYHNVLNDIHGKTFRVVLDEDPGGYYYGRFTVDKPEYENSRMFLTLIGNLHSYRYDVFTTTEDWLWDTFSFETGVIREYRNISINSPSAWYQHTVIGSNMNVTPNIILNSGSIEVQYLDCIDSTTKTYTLATGDNYIPNLVIGGGETILKFKGSGSISIDYKTGVL